MKAVQFDQYGPPEVLRVSERETPVPGPNQLQIKVSAAGVNPADYKWRSGSLQAVRQLDFPHVAGYDVAGIVISIGLGVTRFKVGDRVAATVKGGYAEFAVADETSCANVPDAVDLAQAAAVPCSALTGVEMIEEGIKPQPGQTLLITGATGGVGRFALKAALALGVKVVAAVRPEYRNEALALGAAEVILLGEEITSEIQFDHVADTIGGPAAAELCKQVKPGGRIVWVGGVPFEGENLPSPVQRFSYHADGARLADIFGAIARGEVTVPIACRMPFSAAPEAHRLMEAGGLRGRIVLEP